MLAEYPNSQELSGLRCPSCGHTTLAPAGACQACHMELFDWNRVALDPHGVLRHFAAEKSARPAGGPLPSVRATVEMSDGPRIPARLVDFDPEALRPGQPLKLVGYGAGAWLFTPAGEPAVEEPELLARAS